MSDGNSPHVDQRAAVAARSGLRVFQFSLTNAFIVMTAFALMLSVYFGVGRWVGMSTRDVLMQGFTRLLISLPTHLVWIVGLTIAVRRLKQNRVPAKLTIIALSGLVLTSFCHQVVQLVVIHALNSRRMSGEVVAWSFTLMGVLGTVLDAVLWILILIAVFIQRPHDNAKPSQGD